MGSLESTGSVLQRVARLVGMGRIIGHAGAKGVRGVEGQSRVEDLWWGTARRERGPWQRKGGGPEAGPRLRLSIPGASVWSVPCACDRAVRNRLCRTRFSPTLVCHKHSERPGAGPADCPWIYDTIRTVKYPKWIQRFFQCKHASSQIGCASLVCAGGYCCGEIVRTWFRSAETREECRQVVMR